MTNGQILRVIAGKYKGRVLHTPGGGVRAPKNRSERGGSGQRQFVAAGQTRHSSTSGTHPMGSREKLALFNMLQAWLPGAKVLDIYAGSGALGIEALSRGASEAVFVERDPRAERVIRENLRQVAPDSSAQVYRDSAARFAQRPEFNHYFNIILADPPYDDFRCQEIQELVSLLSGGGVLALSYPKELQLELSGVELISRHSYAAAGIALYRKA